MTDATPGNSQEVIYYDLTEFQPDSFKPEGVVYYKIGVVWNPKIQAPVYKVVYADSRRDVTLEEYLKTLFPAGPEQTVVDQERFAPPGPGPLDLPVDRPCHMIIELDRSKPNWQFDSDAIGLTMKADYGARNARLNHVNDRGEVLGPNAPGDGCHIVYFSVVAREGDDDVEGYNLAVEFIGDSRPIRVVFDPDIPNKGGRFP